MDTTSTIKSDIDTLNAEYNRLDKFNADDDATKQSLENRKKRIYDAITYSQKKLDKFANNKTN